MAITATFLTVYDDNRTTFRSYINSFQAFNMSGHTEGKRMSEFPRDCPILSRKHLVSENFASIMLNMLDEKLLHNFTVLVL